MNALPAVIAEAALLVDAELEQRLPAATCAPVALHAAMRHAVFSGGKRIRPALALAAFRDCTAVDSHHSSADAAALAAMAALELLHTYTLVHDDLPAMDDDDLRRGRPTVHVQWDEATAILTGDALQTAAFATIADVGADAVRAPSGGHRFARRHRWSTG